MTKAAHQTRKDFADAKADGKPQNVVLIRADSDSDPLAHFGVEGERAAAVAVAISPPRRVVSKKLLSGIIAGVAVSLVIVATIVYARQRTNAPSPVGKSEVLEHARLNSRPEGAAVVVDGVARGVTPIELALSIGAHDVILRNDAGERQLTVTVEKGTRASENVDMPAAVASGQLDVTSEPLGARVIVDGAAAGRTPLKVKGLAVGHHAVVVADGTASVNRAVDVTAGTTVSMFISLATTGGAATGTVAIDSPLELRLLEEGRLLGLSNGAPLVLAPGKHRLDLVSDVLEMRLSRIVTVEANKTARVAVPPPNGTLFINASPWAEVNVDGRNVGVTPLGDVSVAVGSHDVVFRHPQLGERRKTVVVGAQTPVRLTMDMNSR
jgi:serine/threonine-protein kinase